MNLRGNHYVHGRYTFLLIGTAQNFGPKLGSRISISHEPLSSSCDNSPAMIHPEY
jgi:hypothetical protein